MVMAVVIGKPVVTTLIRPLQFFPAKLQRSVSEKQTEIWVTSDGGGGRRRSMRRRMLVVVSAKGRGGGGGANNRKPLQRGRDLSIETIQTVQALKRAFPLQCRNLSSLSNSPNLDRVLHSKFSRLLKFDMIAVLRELLRQNHCLLALKVALGLDLMIQFAAKTRTWIRMGHHSVRPALLLVFEVIRMEQWYKPQVSLYVDMATVLARNGFLEHVELLLTYLKAESNLGPETDGFSALLRILMSFNITRTSIVVECYNMMKALGCEPDRPTFKLLVNGLELMGQSGASAIIRQDAQKYYGEYLDFLQEEDGISMAKTWTAG